MLIITSGKVCEILKGLQKKEHSAMISDTGGENSLNKRKSLSRRWDVVFSQVPETHCVKAYG